MVLKHFTAKNLPSAVRSWKSVKNHINVGEAAARGARITWYQATIPTKHSARSHLFGSFDDDAPIAFAVIYKGSFLP